MPTEARSVWSTRHGGPVSSYGSARVTTNTSVTGPLPSYGTRSVASDSNAALVASWRSCEIAALRDGPFGNPPSSEREIRPVSRSVPGSNEMPPGVIAARAGAASASRPRSRATEGRRATTHVIGVPHDFLKWPGRDQIRRGVYKYPDDRPQ